MKNYNSKTSRTPIHRSKPFIGLAKLYFDFFSDASKVKYPLNFKVDISLKQRRLNRTPVFVMDRSPVGAVPVLHSPSGDIRATAMTPTKNFLKTRVYDPFDCMHVLSQPTVRPTRRRGLSRSNRDLAIFSQWHYLSEDECRKTITRIVNELNRRIFKGRACRTHEPERISVLACMHDKDTRRHFHLLFGTPPFLGEYEFKRILRTVLGKHKFVYQKRKVERVKNLAKAIGYNVEPAKNKTGSPVIFEAWQQPSGRASYPNGITINEKTNRDRVDTVAA